jgi:putative restriction endonuclease
MILSNYEGHCAITGINIPELLVAGHIIPWAESSPQQKLNPENGICLSALYDKAFDKGLITISPDDFTICLSSALCEYETQDYFEKHFGSVSGQKITMPIEHHPNRDFLAYHRDKIFLGK